jgi:dTMP kinase
VEQGLKRASRRGEADRIEQESLVFFERVRQAYLARAETMNDRFEVIDASRDIDQVWSQIESILERRLG